MAKCETGYPCGVCGREVEDITDSELYLQFVLGEIHLEQLHTGHDQHIRCNPATAQFIIDLSFEPVPCQGVFAKENLDRAWVAEQEQRYTRAWRRLQELPKLRIPIEDYPLPEARKGKQLPAHEIN